MHSDTIPLNVTLFNRLLFHSDCNVKCFSLFSGQLLTHVHKSLSMTSFTRNDSTRRPLTSASEVAADVFGVVSVALAEGALSSDLLDLPGAGLLVGHRTVTDLDAEAETLDDRMPLVIPTTTTEWTLSQSLAHVEAPWLLF